METIAIGILAGAAVFWIGGLIERQRQHEETKRMEFMARAMLAKRPEDLREKGPEAKTEEEPVKEDSMEAFLKQ